VIEACHESLRRLGTDYIDLYLMHSFDPHTPFEETARALDHLQQSGKIRYAGFSNFYAWQAQRFMAIQQQNRYAPLAAAQLYYSLLNRDIEYELVPMQEANGLGLMVWSPLSGGFLSGKYTRDNPDGGAGRLSGFSFPPIDRALGYNVVDQLQQLAREYGATPAQIALAWLLAKKHVSSIVIGGSQLTQIESNLGAAAIDLTPETVQLLDSITAPPQRYPQWMPTGDATINQLLARQDQLRRKEGWKIR
jgi:aryl-alcohol dehydrogenase-like predicted oxidoreductase